MMEFLESVKKNIEADAVANTAVNWPEIKKILLQVVSTLNGIAGSLPSGTIKNIINFVSGVITMIIGMLPE